jgi:hypothetical protein
VEPREDIKEKEEKEKEKEKQKREEKVDCQFVLLQ